MNRRHTGGGPRPDRNVEKREQATDRNAAWAELSAQKQLSELDRRLGKGVGAKKQRARLARRVAA